ncbi:uncharacterized protein LOC128730829 [Anopheles nili]|uniref:uncharacterized protein LOC128730829 n=1 Tax=Anopheles nili TaxID=185578 RepID=UPI00237C3423|nr:uncharacterized protein LOC128730829 [Anopheles nili]
MNGDDRLAGDSENGTMYDDDPMSEDDMKQNISEQRNAKQNEVYEDENENEEEDADEEGEEEELEDEDSDDPEENTEEELELENEKASESDDGITSGVAKSSNRKTKLSVTVSKKKIQRVTPLLKKKKRKAGVVYINSIPKHMNVTILRSLLEPFGELGRIYLQPSQKDGKVRMKTANGKRAMVKYTEGWVEFLDKRVAKSVVPMLNMHPITNKKKSVFRDILWSMKYLSGFKWVHLNERLTYERAVAKEKLREQIHQIRKEVMYHETKVHHKEMAQKNAEREKKANKKEQ